MFYSFFIIKKTSFYVFFIIKMIYYGWMVIDMKRTIYNDLMNWKKKQHKKPLIIKGARQVGNNVKLEIM